MSTPDLGGDPIDPNVAFSAEPPGGPLYYGPTGYGPAGYGPAGYVPYGYFPAPYWSSVSRRPGEILTAAILSLVDAALLLVVGFVVILASSTADDTGDTFSATDRAGLYVGAGLMNILVAIALIVGAVLLLTRSPNGRPTIVVANPVVRHPRHFLECRGGRDRDLAGGVLRPGGRSHCPDRSAARQPLAQERSLTCSAVKPVSRRGGWRRTAGCGPR